MPASRPFAIFAVVILLACLSIGCANSFNASVKAASLKPDKDRREAPDFTLKDADGKPVTLSDYKGKVVLLDFWATWCGPCKIEIPWFMGMQRDHKDKGFEVLGVAMDDEGWEVVKPFVSDLKINYRVMIGNDDTTKKYGGVDALPTTFLIDKGGKIAAVHVGLANRKDFEDGVLQLLQEPGSKPGGIIPNPGLLMVPSPRY